MEEFRIVDPVLPEPRKFLKYYEMSQAKRHYSNGGPCVNLLEERFEKLLNANVVTCNNATSGLTAVLSVLKRRTEVGTSRLPYETNVAMSDFTYAATACAIDAAGCNVRTHDINSEFAIDYQPLDRQGYHQSRIIVVTCPFGAIPFHTIESLVKNHQGMKIVVDAAASLGLPWKDLKRLVKLVDAVVFSLHATKTFGIGEGGLVACKDVEFAYEVKDFMSFYLQRRKTTSTPAGMNGKMPEISAAIALAKLDSFESDNNRRVERAMDYIMDIMVDGMELYPFEHTYQVIPFIVKNSFQLETALTLYRIPFRKYYEAPLGSFICNGSREAHRQNVCLPFSELMSVKQVQEIKRVLKIFEYMQDKNESYRLHSH